MMIAIVKRKKESGSVTFASGSKFFDCMYNMHVSIEDEANF